MNISKQGGAEWKDVEAFEKACHVTLPTDYKEFLVKYNGGETPKTSFYWNKIQSYVSYFFGLGDVEYSIQKQELSDWLKKGVIPIAEDTLGNTVVISVKRAPGTILFADREEGTTLKPMTSTFSTFIRGCKSEEIDGNTGRTLERVLLTGDPFSAFEDRFSMLQTDMIAVGMEYAQNRAEKVFIYGSREGQTTMGSFFFQIHGQLVKNGSLNKTLQNGEEPFDDSTERAFTALKILISDINQIEALCKEYGREMPTEMKIVYDARTNRVEANYRYGPVIGTDPRKSAGTMFENWFAEEAAKAEKEAGGKENTPRDEESAKDDEPPQAAADETPRPPVETKVKIAAQGGASEKAVMTFQEACYCILPEDYKTFLLKYNGGETPRTTYRKDSIQLTLRCFYGVGAAEFRVDAEELQERWLEQNVIPIAEDSIGRRIVMDLEDGPCPPGNIYYWPWDMEEDLDSTGDDELVPLADTFTEFLSLCRSRKGFWLKGPKVEKIIL